MSKKNEALRLADEIAAMLPTYVTGPVAAELRRLNEEVETNGTIIQYHEASIARLTSQRDALLEALKLARSIIGHPDDAHSQMIDAAIKAVEGETT